MGRPPIGKVAMTGTERSRKSRLRHQKTMPGTADTAALQVRIAALEAELAQRRRSPPPLPRDWQAAKRAATQARKAARATAGPAAQEALPIEEELARERAKLAAAQTRIANLNRKVRALTDWANGKGLALTKRLHREIRFHLHPDRVQDPELRKRANDCLQAFNALKVTLADD